LKNVFADALGCLEPELVDAVLQERFQRMAALARKKERRRRLEKLAGFFRRPGGILAAGLALCGILAVLLLPRSSQPGGLPVETTAPPQYVPAYDTPDLETLYETEPFSLLLPRQLPEGSKLTSSYRALYDPVANPEGLPYVNLGFDVGNEVPMYLSMGIWESGRQQVDLQDPATYDMAWYYAQAKQPGFKQADIPDFVLDGAIPAEDVTLSYVEARAYPDPDTGICSLEITIICGEYYLSCDYYGAPLPPEMFYEMLTSGLYFQENGIQ